MTCETCGDELTIGDWPFCKGPGSHQPYRGGIISDDIPGGLIIKHALFDKDGNPQKFYSKSSIKAAAFAAGLTHGYDTPKPNPRLQDAEQAKNEGY